MSADNYSQCPICHNLPEKYRNGIGHLYGKIPEKEYLAVKADCDNLASNETVRVDYELIIKGDGTLSISYFAKCVNCGAEWVYNKKGIKHSGGVMQE